MAPEGSNQPIVDAFVSAAHGDFEQVCALLAAHPELVNASATWDETALQAAAQTGRADIAEFLLAAGAPLDICAAAMLGKADAVRAFLRAEPVLANARGAHGLPALYHATIAGHEDIADLLWATGADLNAGDGASTALHGAVAFGRQAMVAWLLQRGANTGALDYEGKTPLERAVENGRQEIVEMIRQHAANA